MRSSGGKGKGVVIVNVASMAGRCESVWVWNTWGLLVGKEKEE